MAAALAYTARVHSANRQLVAVNATVAGSETVAMVDGLKVELTPIDPQQGSLTVSFYGADLATASELFKPDSELTVAFAPKEAK